MTLADLLSGEEGIITKVRGRGAFRKRLIEMGFVKGKPVKVIKNAPFKDPIEYKLIDYNVSLRRNEAALIDVVTPSKNEKQRIEIFNGIITSRLKKTVGKKSRTINIALVGNPNSGKTTLFNKASGSRERVGNYSGVTVEAKECKFSHGDYTFNIIDLPGTYSITGYSQEELFVRNYIFEKTPDIVINVIDSSNIERNLYLTTQLIDMDIKVIVALNMFDEFEDKGDFFNYNNLGKMIGIPFVPTVSSKGKGFKELFDKAIDVYEEKDKSVRHIHINYGTDIESSIHAIQEKINIPENCALTDRISSRFLAIKLIEKDKEVEDKIYKNCENRIDILTTTKNEIDRLEPHLDDDSETLIVDAKYGFISGALRETYMAAKRPAFTKSEKIDNIVTHRYLGFPIFLIFMWLTFQLTFTLGEYPMNWIESFIKFLSHITITYMPQGLLKDLLVDGILAGVGGVVVFLPNILILFFMISLMEDSGYMARASFIMDKLMHKIGLHGKSFIPLIMGFGCNVPAIMATRTLESRNDRLLTMLIVPFMSCSARLPVYVLFISAFFPGYSGTMLFLIYFIGVTIATGSAIILKKTLFSSNEIPFVMELPPYRIPHLHTTTSHMWEKGSEYLKKIGGVILIASILIWALGKFPLNIEYSRDYDREINKVEENYKRIILSAPSSDKSFLRSLTDKKNREVSSLVTFKEKERLRKSYIGRIGHFIEPVIKPLGFDWKMGISILSGLAAKEIVVSTMGVLYKSDRIIATGDISLAEKLKEQKFTEGENEGKLIFTPLTAFAFLMFVLLYFPCIAVIATIRKESGSWKWPLFAAVYTTVLAWIVAFSIFQVGSFLIT